MIRFASLVFFSLLCLSACAPSRSLMPPGEIPEHRAPLTEDEQYGHEVLSQLTQQYPLDRDDDRIDRVRNIVDKLTTRKGPNNQVWHVYVLVGNDIKNAAATRGNFIFIWTGMLETVQSDGELAGILAHEIAHILAEHTQLDPTEAASQMISGIAGEVAREVIYQQGGYIGALAGIGEFITKELLNAIILNPTQQLEELEADQIGLFLVAESGINPEDMVNFWRRVKNDPNFQSFPIQFLSSHPSSDDRLSRLEALLPQAMARYRGETPPSTEALSGITPSHTLADEQWTVVEPRVNVRSSPNTDSKIIAVLLEGDTVTIDKREGRWLKITSPQEGYVYGPLLAPEK